MFHTDLVMKVGSDHTFIVRKADLMIIDHSSHGSTTVSVSEPINVMTVSEGENIVVAAYEKNLILLREQEYRSWASLYDPEG